MNASEIAKHAAGLVSGDRHKIHGDKHVTFDRIVRLWNAYMQCRFGIGAPTLTPLDAAQMMSLLKKARAMSGAHNPDDYVDDVGYAAIAGEIADQDKVVKSRIDALQRQQAAEDEWDAQP